jgi:hypothetical protein
MPPKVNAEPFVDKPAIRVFNSANNTGRIIATRFIIYDRVVSRELWHDL